MRKDEHERRMVWQLIDTTVELIQTHVARTVHTVHHTRTFQHRTYTVRYTQLEHTAMCSMAASTSTTHLSACSASQVVSLSTSTFDVHNFAQPATPLAPSNRLSNCSAQPLPLSLSLFLSLARSLFTSAMSTAHTIGANLAYTEQEQRNIQLCQQYMTIAYNPQLASADAVAHLCTANSTFIGQSTFPKATTVPQYAAVHREVMDSIHDLQLLQYDWIVAKGNCVTLRYTATGSHTGQPWHGVAGNGAKATWHAAMFFEIDEKEGKISKVSTTVHTHTQTSRCTLYAMYGCSRRSGCAHECVLGCVYQMAKEWDKG